MTKRVSCFLAAVIAVQAQQTVIPKLEWPGLPVDPPGSGSATSKIVRLTYLPSGGVLLEPLVVPPMWRPSSWSMMETVSRGVSPPTDFCVDAVGRRLVASVFVVSLDGGGVARYVHYAIGTGAVMAEWAGCATGIRLLNPAFELGPVQSVRVFASDAMPDLAPRLAGVSPGAERIALLENPAPPWFRQECWILGRDSPEFFRRCVR